VIAAEEKPTGTRNMGVGIVLPSERPPLSGTVKMVDSSPPLELVRRDGKDFLSDVPGSTTASLMEFIQFIKEYSDESE
jgi:hypothetical protein